MRPRPLAVAFGVLTALELCLVTGAQKQLLQLAFDWDVHYMVVPLLALCLWTLCLSVAAQTILQAVRERTRITTDVYQLYRID
jgi:hypothetical protein